jgi:hypothetical protein
MLYRKGVEKYHSDLSISHLLETSRKVQWMYDLFIDDVYQKLEKFSSHHLIDANNVYAHEKEDMPKYVVGDENYEMEAQNTRITHLLNKLRSKLLSSTQGIISSLTCIKAHN